MPKINLKIGDFIISKTDNSIKDFLKSSVNNYFTELRKYIQDNNDPEIFHYATE